ncbi:MAG: hypothetical protein VKN60_05455 [Cyanobacteriota bacterium]|nr:hypothetical protein [Cyanobacteriota bacterium]
MKTLLAVLLGGALTLSALPGAAQTSADSKPSPEKLGMMMEIGAVLNPDQRAKLQTGLSQGQEVKDVLSTLDLSRQQKIQILKILKSEKGEP